jgi:hypothetical protein
MIKRFLSLLFLAALFLQSCSEDVNLAGDFKETAIVYGLLDQADSIHYVKITRAFIGPGNALDIAQIADSSYFDQVDATVSEVVNGTVTRTWILKDTLIQDKDTNGYFYGPEQKVYYFKTLPTGTNEVIQTSTDPLKSSLKPTALYRFNASINNGAFEVSGETALVRGITTNSSSQNYTFKFADSPGEYLSTGLAVSNSGNSYLMNGQLDVAYNEYIAGIPYTKTYNWKVGEKEVTPNSSLTFSISGRSFYDLMKQSIVENPLVEKRTMKGIYITITGGAEELYNYITVNKPSSGLAQSKPSYTNLSVTNGKRVVGIFSSRQTLKIFKPFYTSPQQAYIRAIDKKSTRELCQGPITGNYLFCSNHPGDNVVNQEESYACQ